MLKGHEALWTRTEPTALSRGNPAIKPCAEEREQRLGQGERLPSNKPYLQRVTEWTSRLLRLSYWLLDKGHGRGVELTRTHTTIIRMK